MYISLYRKYRPQTFSDMVGQSAAVSVLQESLKENKLGHAYLFSGPRGCGKTSAARLVAKSLNCQNLSSDYESCGECSSCIGIALGEHLDVIEIDGASNRGIGEIRDLKSHVNLKPLSAPYKVYIIDEVHMLTEPAFNALLKTLEEPPANVIFLLATTEPHKVPVTIRSRCQHIPFHRISIADMISRIKYVCEKENISFEDEAVWELARQADGALRDSLSLTEQAVALGRGNLTLESVKDLTGGSNRTELEKWTESLHKEPAVSAVELNKMLASGMSPERFCESLFAIFRDLWIYSLWKDKGLEALELSDSGRIFLQRESSFWTAQQLRSVCLFCNSLLPRTRYGMRIEVFAGLIMLELTGVIEGASVNYELKPQPFYTTAPQPLLKPKTTEPVICVSGEAISPAAAKATETQRTADFASVKNSPDPDMAAVVPDIIKNMISAAAPSKANFDTSRLSAELGTSDYADLVTALETKNLLIGAALLNARLIRTDEGWKTETTADSLSELVLSMPQNKQILSDAIKKLWNIGGDETSLNKQTQKESTVPMPMQITPTQAVAFNSATMEEDKKTEEALAALPAADISGRMLKLMGAEILYIHEAGFSDEDEESCEHNG